MVYRTADGRTMRERGSMGSNPPRFTPGQEVEVSYLPGSPERIRIEGEGPITLIVLFSGFSLVFLAIAAVIAITRP
ncbi:hypothetical protein HDA36_006326 [Nocardiopsis composta]|uniref:DUF3592 domain-containing protein n=1 Tax=Nocardiopsis composta TaxID=157465 RepID=A0A7W8VHF5_9ACTN|nr:hypothetical protein [Nocardiopsis composta]